MRLYAFGHGTAAYEEFDLAFLDDPAELRRLILLCHSVNLLGTATASHVAEAITGAHWSGPRFFGVKPTRTTSGAAAVSAARRVTAATQAMVS